MDLESLSTMRDKKGELTTTLGQRTFVHAKICIDARHNTLTNASRDKQSEVRVSLFLCLCVLPLSR